MNCKLSLVFQKFCSDYDVKMQSKQSNLLGHKAKILRFDECICQVQLDGVGFIASPSTALFPIVKWPISSTKISCLICLTKSQYIHSNKMTFNAQALAKTWLTSKYNRPKFWFQSILVAAGRSFSYVVFKNTPCLYSSKHIRIFLLNAASRTE